jgi:hypothetical protein
MNANLRILPIIIIFFSAFAAFSSEREISPFSIITPRSVGMGNADISLDSGFEALWTNPAILSTSKTELNILGIDASLPGASDEILPTIQTLAKNPISPQSILAALEPAIEGNRTGLNAGTGISWVGKRLGIGLYDSLDVYLAGSPFPSGVSGYADNTIALLFGYAYPFRLGDEITLSAGLGLRPSLKYRLDITGDSLASFMSGSTATADALKKLMSNPAFGVPIDLGARATFPFGLSAAMTVNNLFATYGMSDGSGDTYRVPVSFDAGGAWHPDLGGIKWLVDPTFSVELSKINDIISGDTGVWPQTHLGAEFVLLKSFITIWTGLDGGMPAFGANLDLFVLDLSLAYGSAGYGRFPGEQPVSEFTVEVSLRID